MLGLIGDWLGAVEATALLVLIGLATLGTAALFGVAAAGAFRRRTRPYLLLTVAIGLLVARSLLGFGTVLGAVPMPVHHLASHSVDLAIALLVLGAVAAVDRPPSPE